MKKIEEIEFDYKCSKCGFLNLPNQEKSNENWKVYDTTCQECGAEFYPRIVI